MFASAPFGFFSGGAGVVNLAGGTAEHFSLTLATAGWQFNSNGTIDVNRGGWTLNVQRWYLPTQAGIGSSFWIRATLLSGTSPGNLNTWFALSSARIWTRSASPNAFNTSTLLIEISTTNSAAGIVTDGTYSMEADANTL